jgi:hypothetical protein
MACCVILANLLADGFFRRSAKEVAAMGLPADSKASNAAPPKGWRSRLLGRAAA